MQRYQWSRLNGQQVGAYTEYFVKMELTIYGFQFYSSEVDDRSIDFVARHERGPFIEVQVKSLRSLGYVFMEKSRDAQIVFSLQSSHRSGDTSESLPSRNAVSAVIERLP